MGGDLAGVRAALSHRTFCDVGNVLCLCCPIPQPLPHGTVEDLGGRCPGEAELLI